MAEQTEKVKKINPHEGHRARLRKNFLKYHLRGMHEHEILELLLFYPIARKNTNVIAHELISHCGGFPNVFDANIEKLCEIDGVGVRTAVWLKALIAIYEKYGGYRTGGRIILENDTVAGAYYSTVFKPKNGSRLGITIIDNMNAVLYTEQLDFSDPLADAPEIVRRIAEIVYDSELRSCIIAHYRPGAEDGSNDFEAAALILNALSNYAGVNIKEYYILRDHKVKACLSAIKSDKK